MKKFLLAALIIIAGAATATAQKQEKLVVHAGQFSKIDLADEMNVVLVPAASADSLLKIGADASKMLKVTLSSDELHIMPQHQTPANAIVYILVNDLRSLTLGRSTHVRNEGTLFLNKLDMYLQDDCTVKLRTNGKVKAYSLGEFEIVMRRSPVGASVSSAF